MINLNALRQANADHWSKAKVTRRAELMVVGKRLVASKARYQAVEAATKVPWPVIAVIHEREASQRWDTQLGQGDPLNRVSVHVPAGRGPFSTWEDGAIDALMNCRPYTAHNKDWSIGALLTVLEEYNGLGYAARGVPSPYVWSGTDVYVSGKYVRDGVFDPAAIDAQLGCAGLLMAMMALDRTITMAAGAHPEAAPIPKPAPAPPAAPSITNPAKGSVGAAIASALSAIFSMFRRK